MLSILILIHYFILGLDGNYAAFGKVTSGIEVVDKIVESVSKYGDDNGILNKKYQPVIEYIKVIE